MYHSHAVHEIARVAGCITAIALILIVFRVDLEAVAPLFDGMLQARMATLLNSASDTASRLAQVLCAF